MGAGDAVIAVLLIVVVVIAFAGIGVFVLMVGLDAHNRLCSISGKISMNERLAQVIQPYSFSNWTDLNIEWNNGTDRTYHIGELSQWRINEYGNLTLKILADSPLALQVYDANGKVADFNGSWQFRYAQALSADWSGIHVPGPFFRVGNPNPIPISVTLAITGYATTNDC